MNLFYAALAAVAVAIYLMQLWLTYIRLKKIFEELEEEKED